MVMYIPDLNFISMVKITVTTLITIMIYTMESNVYFSLDKCGCSGVEPQRDSVGTEEYPTKARLTD